MGALQYRGVQTSPEESDLKTISQHMFALMMRNIASDGLVFADPLAPGGLSRPGCVIASPSYPSDPASVNQDYVFNWTRDAAITAIELAAATVPSAQTLADYVGFADMCLNSGPPTVGHACYTIGGKPRHWSEQSDGPALQTLALLEAYPQLDLATQTTAQTVIGRNLAYLLGVYRGQTVNLWEEVTGASFFARSVQLRCFQEVSANRLRIPIPKGTDAAITWLQSALQTHWDGGRYVSVLPAPDGYDPNIDIVLAVVYGAMPSTDTKLLATAAALRAQWADSASPSFYAINATDAQRGFGPVLGRYPGDSYDGDTQDRAVGGHPWAACTCHFAELYYRLANEIAESQTLPFDDLSAGFFGQIGIGAQTPPNDAQTALQSAGDKMLQAVVLHSDQLELSEQFDGTSGHEKSVRNLTWGYAAFVSAVRAKTGVGALG